MKTDHSASSLSIPNPLPNKVAELQARLSEALDTIEAIRSGAADAVIGNGPQPNVLTLAGADLPYRMIVEMMGEGSVTLATDGTILYCNDQFAQMVDRTSEELVGLSFRDLLAAGQHPKLEQMLDCIPDQIRRERVTLKRSDGEIPVQIATRSLALAGVQGTIATVTDLTEIEAARQARDSFFASMSHELRTPLTSILGYVGMLLGGLGGPLTAEQERQLSVVKTSGLHLLSLLNNLLDFAKLEAGKVAIHFEPSFLQRDRRRGGNYAQTARHGEASEADGRYAEEGSGSGNRPPCAEPDPHQSGWQWHQIHRHG